MTASEPHKQRVDVPFTVRTENSEVPNPDTAGRTLPDLLNSLKGKYLLLFTQGQNKPLGK